VSEATRRTVEQAYIVSKTGWEHSQLVRQPADWLRRMVTTWMLMDEAKAKAGDPS
jgi:hypothetical protein